MVSRCRARRCLNPVRVTQGFNVGIAVAASAATLPVASHRAMPENAEIRGTAKPSRWIDGLAVRLMNARQNIGLNMKHEELKVANKDNLNEAYCPIPLSVIPNQMGINLCSVESVAWVKQEDDQLVSLTIKFNPEPREAGSDAPLESVEARYKDLLFRLGVLGHDGAVAEITALRKAANLDG